jgi:hypothetical protein
VRRIEHFLVLGGVSRLHREFPRSIVAGGSEPAMPDGHIVGSLCVSHYYSSAIAGLCEVTAQIPLAHKMSPAPRHPIGLAGPPGASNG